MHVMEKTLRWFSLVKRKLRHRVVLPVAGPEGCSALMSRSSDHSLRQFEAMALSIPAKKTSSEYANSFINWYAE